MLLDSVIFNNNVDTFQSPEISLEASFHVHRAPFFRPKCLPLQGHVTALTTITWQQKLIVDGGGSSINWLKRKVREAIKIKIRQLAMNRDQGYEFHPSTMNFCCHVIIVKAVTWLRRGRHFGLKKGARCTWKLASNKMSRLWKVSTLLYIIQWQWNWNALET